MQTIWVSPFLFLVVCKPTMHLWTQQANFAKQPNNSPAPNWPAYVPTQRAIANLAFGNNVALDNVVQIANTSDVDRACALLDTLPL